MNLNEYQCAMCRGVFEYAWTEEEAVAEKERDFRAVPLEDCAVICDDCYQRVRPDTHPAQYAAWREDVRSGHSTDGAHGAPQGAPKTGE